MLLIAICVYVLGINLFFLIAKATGSHTADACLTVMWWPVTVGIMLLMGIGWVLSLPAQFFLRLSK